MTRIGYYKVTFSIPSTVYDTFLAFSVEDIKDRDHARMIERALADGGCTSVYMSLRVADERQPFVSVDREEMEPGHVGRKVQEMLASMRQSRQSP